MSVKRAMKGRVCNIIDLKQILKPIFNSIPNTWKKVVKEKESDNFSLVLLEYELLKNNHTLSVGRMISIS